MQCRRLVGDYGRRCTRQADVEILCTGAHGSRWRALCAECAQVVLREGGVQARSLQIDHEDVYLPRRSARMIGR